MKENNKSNKQLNEKEFFWSLNDFERAENWAKSENDPENSNRSLWDRVYSPRKDSVDILHELNMFIGMKN